MFALERPNSYVYLNSYCIETREMARLKARALFVQPTRGRFVFLLILDAFTTKKTQYELHRVEAAYVLPNCDTRKIIISCFFD